ncbi:MAG: PQQ-binding-like beta-propeller repeat protein [Opitutaceae bacterium]|nr:PQQ-binding-like beta-propeller repeat protein [Opitutaceae bacterium]
MKFFMTTTSRTRVLAFTIAALLPALLVSAADWNQWRGPNRDGVASGFKPPATWTKDSLAKKWTVTVGEGHSSPVVVGDRVFVFARENDQEILRCLLLADGKTVWQDAYPAPYDMNPAARNHGKGPKATPTVANDRVFTHGVNGHVSAHDAKTGAVLWRKHFAGEFKSPSPVFGAAASPLVDGNNVIVHVGGDDSGALTAFDIATGKVNWKWDGDGPGYTSPLIAAFGGVRQLITQSQKHCLAVSPADGKLLWKIPFTTPYEQNIVTPVVAGDLVIFGGIQKPTFAVKVTTGEPKPAWETREITMYMSSPVLSGPALYGMSDKQRGMLFSMNASDGAVQWKSEGRLGDNASLTDIGPALLVVTTSGDLIVEQKVGKELKELVRYKVSDSPVWASPAVAGDHILIKDKSSLTLYRINESN